MATHEHIWSMTTPMRCVSCRRRLQPRRERVRQRVLLWFTEAACLIARIRRRVGAV